ncbi:MAG: hypothetical protein ABJP45_18940 [Cyclobacteriaceae bacterium]
MSKRKKNVVSKKTLALYFLFAFLSAPANILLHEYGHYVGALVSGYSNSDVHYASFTRGDAPEEPELDFKRGLISIGGPLLTFLLTIGCCFYVFIKKSKAFVVAFGLTSPVRNLASLIMVFVAVAGGDLRRNDEVKVAEFFDIDPLFPLVFSALVLVVSWVFLVGRIDTRYRWWVLLSIVLGGALGNVLWLTVVGPILVP